MVEGNQYVLGVVVNCQCSKRFSVGFAKGRLTSRGAQLVCLVTSTLASLLEQSCPQRGCEFSFVSPPKVLLLHSCLMCDVLDFNCNDAGSRFGSNLASSFQEDLFEG